MSFQIGDVLVEKGIISREQLAHAEKECLQHGGSLLATIIDIGLAPEKQVYELIADKYGIPYKDVKNSVVPPTLIEILNHDIVSKYAVLPLALEDGQLLIAVADPSNITTMNDLKFMTGKDLKLVLSSELSIRLAQERTYAKPINYEEIVKAIEAESSQAGEQDQKEKQIILERVVEEAPIIKLVDAILSDAIRKNASDIHIEPYEQFYRVRFRIDGVLHEIMRPPTKLKNSLISRIKVMSNLDISERRLPQDGRIKITLPNKITMDFRVNCLPTLYGEKIVLRLLDKSNLQLDVAKLGFDHRQLTDFKEGIHKPYGMVLVTGPTGSGKSTTLYSALSELNDSETNIFTAEDPVEYNLPGINQVQVNDEIGFSFASALRAFLRQDPDVVMVGEIRDLQTAEIAIKASLTGHLVLSTLHTNDAPSTIGRLLNMGVEPFLIATSLNLIVAQRLIRKLCLHCAETYNAEDALVESLGINPSICPDLFLKRPGGCSNCGGTGYKGRIAIYEVMPVDEEMRKLIFQQASNAEIKGLAANQGVATLRLSAINKLIEGVTSLEEVYRVTDSN
jgi:type IV pilus assembly protein PilB